MDTLEYKIFYRRHLPHIQPPGATFFLTYRLAGSLPAAIQEELLAEGERIEKMLSQIENPDERVKQAYLEQRRMFGKWDAALDTASAGPQWLADDRVAQIVAESLHHLHGNMYDLDTYCIMSNHAHAVFTPLVREETAEDESYYALSTIMHSHKRHTARQSNRVLGREGQFWQHESYDHVVRNEQELQRIRRYIIQNPVKAGLVAHWEEWPWSYCKAFATDGEG